MTSAVAVFAEGLGHARHLTVNANGDVYVKLANLKDGKGIYRLRDTNGDGKAEDITGFSDIAGTGMSSPASEVNQSWGSGYGVRLLDRLVADFYEE